MCVYIYIYKCIFILNFKLMSLVTIVSLHKLSCHSYRYINEYTWPSQEVKVTIDHSLPLAFMWIKIVNM